MSDRIVVTMGDERFRPITELTFPTIRDYARRIGADFHIISERRRPEVNICYEKFQMRDLLETHERVLYVDGDVLVRRTAPDVFPMVPAGSFSAMDEGKHIHFWTPDSIREQYAPYGWTAPWNGTHFNAGVMVFDRAHKRLFENPVVTNIMYWDQPCLNVAVERLGVPYHPLPLEFNYMPFHRYKQDDGLPQRAHFVHYAGTRMGPDEKSVHIRRDLGIDIDRGALLALFDATTGYMDRNEGERLLWAAELAAIHSTSKDMVEIGSYAGKSTILLGAAARAVNGRVFAVDPHEGVRGHCPPSMEMFAKTISGARLEATVVTAKMRSYEFTPPGPLGLVFIDADHHYEHVKQDYLHVEPYLEPGGLALFHDYIADFPGVIRFVDEMISAGRLDRVMLTRSMMVTRKKAPAEVRT